MASKQESLTWSQWGFLLAVLLSFHFERSGSQLTITPKPQQPFIGQSVVLTFSYFGESQSVTWFRGRGTIDGKIILTYNFLSKLTSDYGPLYTGRETVLEDGSLHISRLMTNYSGTYTLLLTNQNSFVVGTAELTISSAPGNEIPENYDSTVLPGNTDSANYSGAVVGAVVGGVAVIGLIIAGLVIFIRRKNRRTAQNQGVEEAKPPTRQTTIHQTNSSGDYLQPDQASSSGDYLQPDQASSSGGYLQTDVRRLPSIPPLQFQPESQITTPDQEDPYTELTYEYHISYNELQRTPAPS